MAAEEIGIDIIIKADNANSVGELKASINELKDLAVEAGKAGDEALAQKYAVAAGRATSKINDLNDSINAVKGTGEKLGQISNVANTIAGGFAAAEGAAALFGSSQEDIQKQLLKVQAATALLAGVQQASDFAKQAGILKNIALGELQVANTKLQTAAENGGVVARAAATAGQWALNAAMNANPIAILLVALAALAVAFSKIGTSAEESAAKQVKANEDILASSKKRYDRKIELQKALGKNTLELEIQSERNLIAQQKRNIEYLTGIEDRSEAQQKLLEDTIAAEDESIHKLDVLRATQRAKERDDEEKAAEEKAKKDEKAAEDADNKKKNDDDAAQRNHEQYLEALAKRNKDIEDVAKKHIDELAKFEQDQKAQEQADADAQLAIEEEQNAKDFDKIAKEKERKAKARAEELAADIALANAKIELSQQALNSATALGNILIKDSKKLEAFQKQAALIQIGIDTAKAISGVVAAASSTSITPVDLALKIAAGVATVLANIAKAKQLLSNPGSGSVSLGGSIASVTPPSLKTPGSSGGGDSSGSQRVERLPPQSASGSGSPYIPPPSTPTPIGTGSTQLDENGKPIGQTIRAYVVETEITKTQGTVSAIKERNSF